MTDATMPGDPVRTAALFRIALWGAATFAAGGLIFLLFMKGAEQAYDGLRPHANLDSAFLRWTDSAAAACREQVVFGFAGFPSIADACFDLGRLRRAEVGSVEARRVRVLSDMEAQRADAAGKSAASLAAERALRTWENWGRSGDGSAP